MTLEKIVGALFINGAPFFYSPALITKKKKFFAKYSSDYEPHSSSHNPVPHHHTIIIRVGAMPFKKSFWNNSQQQPAWCAKEKWKKMRTTRTLISTTAATPSGMVLQRSSFL